MNQPVSRAIEVIYYLTLKESECRQTVEPPENRRDLLNRNRRTSSSRAELAAAVIDELIASEA